MNTVDSSSQAPGRAALDPAAQRNNTQAEQASALRGEFTNFALAEPASMQRVVAGLAPLEAHPDVAKWTEAKLSPATYQALQRELQQKSDLAQMVSNIHKLLDDMDKHTPMDMLRNIR